jgi:hypothetical protein
VIKDYFHRRDAKNAEKFFNENNKTLCVLCVFAGSFNLYGRTLIKNNQTPLRALRLCGETGIY